MEAKEGAYCCNIFGNQFSNVGHKLLGWGFSQIDVMSLCTVVYRAGCLLRFQELADFLFNISLPFPVSK